MDINIDLADRQLFKRVLPSFLDGEASEPEKAFVARKINQCSYCRGVYETEKCVQDMIRKTLAKERIAPPADLLFAIQQQCAQPNAITA
jgi:predicted anti-sigma-YlaC factor YlaD